MIVKAVVVDHRLLPLPVSSSLKGLYVSATRFSYICIIKNHDLVFSV
ncbi:hypothetical protein Hdeb2414_s0007g00236301 [Helianthus debilis subsp. tardiflorus]